MAKPTSKNGGSNRSSKPREPSGQVHAQTTLNTLIHIQPPRHVRNLRDQVNAKQRRKRLPIVTTVHNSRKMHKDLPSRLSRQLRRYAKSHALRVNPVHVARQPRIASKSDEDDTDSEGSDTQTKTQMNSEGEMYVDLGKKKRVTVRSFKGKRPLSRLRTC